MNICTENISQYLHTLENFPARISRSRVSYNSDNFLLEYKYFVGVGGATPKYYTIVYNRVYMSEID